MINEPILNHINKFRNHPSIKLLKSEEKERQTFIFDVTHEEVLNKIKNLQNLQTTRKTQPNDVPTKILKEKSEVFSRYFHKNTFFLY